MVLLYQLWLALSERKVMNKNRVNGSIVEKNGIWYARLYVTDENGKRKQIWRTTKLPVKNNKRKNSTARSVKPSTVKLLLQIILNCG